MIFFTSDLHFGHDKEFIWGARGYKSVEEMNEVQVARWNEQVEPDDFVYVLGDLFLGSPDNIKYVKRLNGHLFIVMGNHDTKSRIDQLALLKNVWQIYQHATDITLDGQKLWLCHYPTVVDMPKGKDPALACVFGHTHQSDTWGFEGRPNMVNVGIDYWKYPVPYDTVLDIIRKGYYDRPN